jgi:glycerol-3-phosphate dehydrogenase (NAD(P)+)
LVICAKGVELESGALMSEVAHEVVGDRPLAILSGPTFAHEVARGLPSAVTLACADNALGAAIAAALGGATLRPYLSDDMVGAQIGGALKNVMAIAAGIAIGRGLGENARAAIMTRGFAEMVRLARAKGGRIETLAGLSGLGDLVLTCSSAQSRNFSLGSALGGGESLADILAARESVAEGVTSAPAMVALGKLLAVELPIAEAVDAVLHKGANINATIATLLARPFRPEY